MWYQVEFLTLSSAMRHARVAVIFLVAIIVAVIRN